jgi:hypothetical protein
MITLNIDRGGEIAENLMKLYDFMHRYLVQANMDKDVAKVTIVISMLKELRQTWEEALLKLLEEYRAENPDDAKDMRGRVVSPTDNKVALTNIAQPSVRSQGAVTSERKGVNFAG